MTTTERPTAQRATLRADWSILLPDGRPWVGLAAAMTGTPAEPLVFGNRMAAETALAELIEQAAALAAALGMVVTEYRPRLQVRRTISDGTHSVSSEWSDRVAGAWS